MPESHRREIEDDTHVRSQVPFPSSGSVRPPPRAAARRCPSCKQAFSGDARFCPFDGDALEEAPDWNPSADPLIGQTLDGRYEILGVLGEGGMGTVYEARHAMLGRRFAIKVLRRDIADAELNARFIQEAKAAAAIGHPNIVAVSDFGEVQVGAKTVPYFVMEFLVGVPLSELLRDKRLPPRRIANVLAQCASGLAAAHKAGVVHRDMKPDNIFLAREGDQEFVKLLDFGVAKIVGAGRLTQAGMVFGTPHYMSPEQASGNPVDHRADIYALGVILYECLSGRVPFESDTYMGVLTKHMFTKPEPLALAADAPPDVTALAAVALRCLAKSPSDRFNDMTEVARALEGVASGEEKVATPPPRTPLEDSMGPAEIPGVRPRASWIYAAVGAVALGVLGFVVLGRGLGRSRDPSSELGPSTSAAPAELATSVASSAPSSGSTATPASTTAPSSTSATAAPASTSSAAVTAAAASGSPPSASKSPKAVATAKPHATKRGDIVDPWNK